MISNKFPVFNVQDRTVLNCSIRFFFTEFTIVTLNKTYLISYPFIGNPFGNYFCDSKPLNKNGISLISINDID